VSEAIGQAEHGADRATATDRVAYLLGAVGSVVVLVLARVITPSSTGMGTHERLGLPPCTFWVVTGHGCPGCGLTTSVSHMAHGDVVAAFLANPMGIVFFVLFVVGGSLSWVRLFRPRPLDDVLFTTTVQVVAVGLAVGLFGTWLVRMLLGQV
jgi:hypothetical protein